MILILATVCSILQAEPKKPCKNIVLSFAEEAVDGTPMGLNQMQCFLQGQVEIAKWQESHPNWMLAKWHCKVSNDKFDDVDL